MVKTNKKGRFANVEESRRIVSDPYGMLAAEIVAAAIDDWRGLIKAKAWLNEYPSRVCNFNELRIFFKSEWCEFLMQNFNFAPHDVLRRLEDELQEAILQHQEKVKVIRNERI